MGGRGGGRNIGEHLGKASLTLTQWTCLLTPLTITAAVANFTLRKIRIIPGKIPIHPLGSRILPGPRTVRASSWREGRRLKEAASQGGREAGFTRRSKTTDARRVKDREGAQLGERETKGPLKPLGSRQPSQPAPRCLARPNPAPQPAASPGAPPHLLGLAGWRGG